MNRLQPPPSHLVPRVLLLCLGYALLLLWSGGGSVTNAFAMVAGTLPISPEGGDAIHVLLPRSLRSFLLIVLALGVGLSFALAAALAVSHLGGRAMRMVGWLGRSMAGVPPMGWAMGALVLILRFWHLPIETLFPHETPPELNSWQTGLARLLWQWLAPAVVLALPVFGSSFFSLTHRLSALRQGPGQVTLKARGLGGASIAHRHFAPLLEVQMARIARPAAALLLCFVIPVEEIFGFDGWGRFLAARLSTSGTHTLDLATAMWSGAWMMAALLLVAGLPDRRGLPPSFEDINDHGQRHSDASVGMGAVLLLFLLLPFSAERGEFMASHGLWLREVPRALGAALGALLLVILGIPILLPSLRFRWLADGGIIASLAIAPLALMLLLWEQIHARNFLAVCVALAMPGLAALRAFFLSDTWSGVVDASRAVGESTFGLCRRHLLPLALPGLLNWTVRTAGMALLLFSVLDFYDESLLESTSPTWGSLMRAHHDDLLEHPGLALGPALWIALWSLCFRLLSRAFRTETPQDRPSTFAP
jgi:ABC-type dipeptide/oligopeptide/nickel transport system permease component